MIPMELTSAEEIQHALERGEFVPYYQPIVYARRPESYSIVGMEALVRWNHPTKGLLAPASFLGRIGNWAWRARLGA